MESRGSDVMGWIGILVVLAVALVVLVAGRAGEPSPTTTTLPAPTGSGPAGGGAAPSPGTTTPPPAQGMAPSAVVAAFNKGGCGNCHTIAGVPGAVGRVGPDLSAIGAEAGTRRDGYDAEEYLRESILDPRAYIAPHCPGGDCPAQVMPPNFGEVLAPADLDTIVGYLLVLGTDREADVLVAGGAGAPVALSTELPAESVLEPFRPYPGEPPSAAKIALGRYLFYDQRLSGSVAMSCATCHRPDQAFTDGLPVSVGFPSTSYFRNTPSLFNVVFNDRVLYWDGRMDAKDLPTTVRDHLTEAHFMAMDGRLMVERINQIPAYVDLFRQAFGGEPSFGKVLKALTAYVDSLNSPSTPYDRYQAGDTSALSPEARAGMALFEGKAGCATCHTGPLFSDFAFHDTGVGTDPGLFADPIRQMTYRRFLRTMGVPNFRNIREDVGAYVREFDDSLWGAFRTPPLREVARTAPYMHDGSLATLADVVRFYDRGGGPGGTAGLQPLGLTDTEIDELVAFLEALSSRPVAVEVPELPDYGLVPLGGGA